MILKYSNLPTWQKVLFFPFWVVGRVVQVIWVVLAGIAALIGTITGQVARLLAIVLYFIWMWAFIGWLEGQGMADRGLRERQEAERNALRKPEGEE